MSRRILPQRRMSLTFDLVFKDQLVGITAGFFPSGDLGEVFIDIGKTGADIQSITHDAAVVVSIAIQCGASISEMHHAVLRDADGVPVSVIGAILDGLMHEVRP